MNKKIVVLIIVILSFLYIFLFNTYIDSINEKPNSNLVNINSNILKQNNLEKFIDENYIDNLDSINGYYNDVNNLSNDTKLKYAYMTLSNLQKTIRSKDLNSQVKTVFGNNISLKNNNIKFDKYDVHYDKKNDVYVADKSYLNDYLIIKKINKYEVKNNEATLSMYKFFVRNNKIYGSYDDMIKNYNVIYYVKDSSNISKYIDDNYDENNNKYKLYKYTFKSESNKIILSKYENEKY